MLHDVAMALLQGMGNWQVAFLFGGGFIPARKKEAHFISC